MGSLTLPHGGCVDWAPLGGPVHNSNRGELAVVCVAATANFPARVTTDSRYVVRSWGAACARRA
eukprot:4149095-Lingulodinium_polyedra.AAC.1